MFFFMEIFLNLFWSSSLEKCPRNQERVQNQRKGDDGILAPFGLLSDELDCNRCIAKQTKIMKMIGELSTMTILRICRHVVHYIHSCKSFYVILVNLATRLGSHFWREICVFDDGDKFRYPTTELLRATATKLGSCYKHSVYCQELGSVFSYVL